MIVGDDDLRSVLFSRGRVCASHLLHRLPTGWRGSV
jgi:hypothetical protein